MIITMKYSLMKLNNTATSSIFAPTGYWPAQNKSLHKYKHGTMTTKNMVQKATNLLGLYSDSKPWRIASLLS